MALGVAVIGAGMAGAAHAAAYRVAPTSWQAIAEHPDIHVVSVVMANSLHLEMVEGLVAAGNHLLCEKPLSDTVINARAMADLARGAGTVVGVGSTFRRAPGVAALRERVTSGALGILHVDGRYWCNYASDPRGPISWRFKGAPGSGALADIGSHVAYLAEFLGGDIQQVSGGRFSTAITERPVPLAAVVGHGKAAASDTYEPVENDDYNPFTARLEHGVGAVQVSRVAAGHRNGLALEVFGDNGSARWEQERHAREHRARGHQPAAHRGPGSCLAGSARRRGQDKPGRGGLRRAGQPLPPHGARRASHQPGWGRVAHSAEATTPCTGPAGSPARRAGIPTSARAHGAAKPPGDGGTDALADAM